MGALRPTSFRRLSRQSVICVLLAVGTIALATEAKVNRLARRSDSPASAMWKMKLAAGKPRMGAVGGPSVESTFRAAGGVGATPPRTYCEGCVPADLVSPSDPQRPPRLWQRPPPSV